MLPGADCGTDHELLIAWLRVKFMKLKRPSTTIWYDMASITTSYKTEIRNQIKAIDVARKVSDTLWHDIKSVFLQAAEMHLKKVRRTERTPWMSVSAMDIAKSRRELKAAGADVVKICKLNSKNWFEKTRRNSLRTCEKLRRRRRAGHESCSRRCAK